MHNGNPGWCERRAEMEAVDTETKAWLQEITGALIARGRRL